MTSENDIKGKLSKRTERIYEATHRGNITDLEAIVHGWLPLILEAARLKVSPTAVYEQIIEEKYDAIWAQIDQKVATAQQQFPEQYQKAVTQLQEFITIFERQLAKENTPQEKLRLQRRLRASFLPEAEKDLTLEDQWINKFYQDLNVTVNETNFEQAIGQLVANLKQFLTRGTVTVAHVHKQEYGGQSGYWPQVVKAQPARVELELKQFADPDEVSLINKMHAMAYHYTIGQIATAFASKYLKRPQLHDERQNVHYGQVPVQEDRQENKWLTTQLVQYGLNSDATAEIERLFATAMHEHIGQLYMFGAEFPVYLSDALITRQFPDEERYIVRRALSSRPGLAEASLYFQLSDICNAIYHFAAVGIPTQWNESGLHPANTAVLKNAARSIQTLLGLLEDRTQNLIQDEDFRQLSQLITKLDSVMKKI